MNKKLIICCLSTLLSGCLYQSLNSFDLERAVHVCEGVENIGFIETHFDGRELVKCKNKPRYFTLDEVSISE